MFSDVDKYFMKLAIAEAYKSFEEGEVPVGAVVVRDDEVISYGRNIKGKNKNALLHAEMVAIHKSVKMLDDWRLNECTLYVTCEPCVMCAGAILHCRIKKVIFGAFEPKFGGVVSNLRVFDTPFFNHKVRYEFGLFSEEISKMMKNFFKQFR
ncbi:CMP/dCMP deaminase, zinc-binding protein [Deferribacter desulfuricans SSM1]|uniref:tRNA-specific adenosine deaminase n=1 Tax=Deferribacter desulfuricans (strain DSM 14783 / JCM 11476 / NBRC 101012 / SSM1) TaxID=639282 RepID=D3PE08_DEFDS|nr:nucleoside deaminase [Deferribacter desulfuricans]BAI80831.1 CMP/dCMP deaminase, zinc-binding protein [Deferribacter desulfuricans SSM1]